MATPQRKMWLTGCNESDPDSPEQQEATRTLRTPLLLPSTGLLFKAGRLDWQEHAACKGSQHLFFSAQEDEDNPKAEPGRKQRIREAKAMCASCKVLEDCEEWAKEVKLPHGILAGKTANERRRLGWGTAPIRMLDF